jgi:hypothetical protein
MTQGTNHQAETHNQTPFNSLFTKEMIPGKRSTLYELRQILLQRSNSTTELTKLCCGRKMHSEKDRRKWRQLFQMKEREKGLVSLPWE